MSATGAGFWSTQPGNPGTALIQTPNSPITRIAQFSKEGTYHFIWTNPVMCSDTVSVIVTAKPNAGMDVSLCTNFPGGNITLSATGNGQWSADQNNPGIVDIQDPSSAVTTIHSFSTAGSYSFIWTNANSCHDTVNVNVYPIPNGIYYKFDACPGNLISVDAGTRKNFSWQGEGIQNPLNDQQTILLDKDKTIYLNFTDSLNCPSRDTFFFHPLIDTTHIFLFRDSIMILSGDTNYIKTGTTVIYCIIGGKVIRWEPDKDLNCNDCPCVKISPEENTSYTVTAVDSFNCPRVFQFTVLLTPINCDTSNVFIPNAFSPNNDTKNDTLLVRCQYLDDKKEVPVINKMHLSIYNRWGEKVFESFNIKDGWDGTFKGELLSPDVFGYFLEAECIGGKKYFKKGNISLLK
jgi:gliding motility-associated-like protein